MKKYTPPLIGKNSKSELNTNSNGSYSPEMLSNKVNSGMISQKRRQE